MKKETRAKIEATILKWVGKIDPSGINKKLYKDTILKNMSDDELTKLISKPLPIYAPNGSDVDINHMRNIEIGKEMGHEFFQRVILTDPRTGVASMTRTKHLVMPLPVRRQSQMIDKKVSIAEHNRTIDTTTGQPVGQSKGSSFSFPQIYVMYAKGYDNTIKELIKVRGGDAKAGQVIDQQIRRSGSSTQVFEGSEHTRVKSTKVAGVLFKAMHLGNNLGE